MPRRVMGRPIGARLASGSLAMGCVNAGDALILPGFKAGLRRFTPQLCADVPMRLHAGHERSIKRFSHLVVSGVGLAGD